MYSSTLTEVLMASKLSSLGPQLGWLWTGFYKTSMPQFLRLLK